MPDATASPDVPAEAAKRGASTLRSEGDDTDSLLDFEFVVDRERAESILDPLRRSILEQLRTPGSATTVAVALGLPRQRVNYHVRALEAVGLLEHVEDRRKGNCVERVVRARAHRYVLDPDLLGDLGPSSIPDDASEDPYSSSGLVAAAARTLADAARLGTHRKTTDEPLPSLVVETSIRFRNPHEEVEFARSLREALARMAERYHHPEAPDGRTFRIAVAGHLDLHSESVR